MEEISAFLKNYREMFPDWFLIIYAVFLAAGIITACANKKNFNRLFWLIIVLVVPFFGTVITIACCIAMNRFTKDKPVYVFDYSFRKKFVLIPFFAASLSSSAARYTADYHTYTSEIGRSMPLAPESVPLFTAFLILLIMFLLSYRKISRSAVCLHINKILPFDEDSCRISKNICGFRCIEEKKEVIPSPHEVKNIAGLYYRGRGLESGDAPWAYKASVGKNEFNFDAMPRKEFTKYLDVERIESFKNNITKMYVLKWDEKAVAEDNRNVPVKRYVLWHTMPSLIPLALETVTSLMMIMISFTPLGLEIFSAVSDLFVRLFF